MANLRLSVFPLLASVGLIAVASGQYLPTANRVPASKATKVEASLDIAVAKATRRFSVTANGSFAAKTPGQPYKSEITSSGQLNLSLGSGRLGVFVHSYGFGSQRYPVGKASVEVSADKVAWPEVRIQRAGISESYVNGTSGLHHWLSVSSRPASSNGSLWVNLAVTGAKGFRSLSDTSTEVTIGATKLKYAGLKVWDSTGRTLPARMVTNATGIGFVVNDAKAKYPVTIDPIWFSETKLSADPPKFIQHFGWSVAVSGSVAVVGTDQWEDPVYVFRKDGSSWFLEQTLTKDTPGFGFAVATSGDKVAVGSPSDSSFGYYAGSVTIYERTGLERAPWVEGTTIYPPEEIGAGQFGSSIAMESNRIVVGAPKTEVGSRYSFGKAFVFQLDRGVALWEGTLVDDDGREEGYAGSSVALSGDNIIVGAPGDVYDAYVVGSAAVYSFESLKWTRKLHLESPDARREDEFGRAVAISNSELFVGAPGRAANAVYVFSDWSSGKPVPKVIRATEDTYQGFGAALGSNGKKLFIGNYQIDSYTGEVVSYEKDFDGSWLLTGRIRASEPSDWAFYGRSLAVSPTDLIVGAWQGHQAKQEYAGAAYVYAIAPPLTSVNVSFPGLVSYGGTPGIYETRSGIGRITLSAPAPAGGVLVELSSSSGVVPVPALIAIGEGESSSEFGFTTSAVPTPGTDEYLQVTATGTGLATGSSNLVVLANKVAKVTGVTINSLGVGSGKVTLAAAASSDFPVNLSSADPSLVQVPDVVWVPAGQISASFPVTSVTAVITITDVNIFATPSNSEKKAKVTVRPQVQINSVSVDPAVILAGSTSTGTVVLEGPAPAGGQVITLASNRTTVSIPATVTLPEGAILATFPVTSTGNSATSALITASNNGVRKTTTLTVVRPTLVRVSVADGTVRGGVQNTAFTVTMSVASPVDLTIRLSSNNPALARVPSTIIVPAGQLTATGTVTTGRWSGATGKAVKITARYASDSAKTTTITITK